MSIISMGRSDVPLTLAYPFVAGPYLASAGRFTGGGKVRLGLVVIVGKLTRWQSRYRRVGPGCQPTIEGLGEGRRVVDDASRVRLREQFGANVQAVRLEGRWRKRISVPR